MSGIEVSIRSRSCAPSPSPPPRKGNVRTRICRYLCLVRVSLSCVLRFVPDPRNVARANRGEDDDRHRHPRVPVDSTHRARERPRTIRQDLRISWKDTRQPGVGSSIPIQHCVIYPWNARRRRLFKQTRQNRICLRGNVINQAAGMCSRERSFVSLARASDVESHVS